MLTLKMLLIEDSTADQVLFVNQVQNDASDVAVDCATSISEAFAYLESAAATPYDQIWLDPGLPDLKPAMIGQVLARLKQHVEPGEVRLLTSTASPEVKRQAKQQDVSLLNKDVLNPGGNSEILSIVREMLTKRSSGGATRVELGKHEMRLLHIEGSVEEMKAFLKDATQRMQRYEETALQVKLMVDLVNQMPVLKDSIGKLEKLVDKDVAARSGQLEVRKSFMQYALPALLTAVTALATIFLTQYFSANKPAIAPSVAPSSN